MDESLLLSEYELPGGLALNNRIVMAPMTRCFADADLAPIPASVDYYRPRADAGLIVTEATLIAPEAQGYPGTPGIYSNVQIAAWKRVVDGVHEAGGRIYCQLWHTGRLAHSHYTGTRPLAPSAVAMEGTLPRAHGLRYEEPQAMDAGDIARVQAEYAKAAQNAMQAGFDGVELHGANGYLIDQFLHQQTNRRSDEYGGTAENRARFALEVIDRLLSGIGPYRVGIRLSPQAYVNLKYVAGDEAAFDYLLEALNQRPMAYVHVATFDGNQQYDYLGGRPLDYARERYAGTIIGCGGYTAETAENDLCQRRIDLSAFGRSFIANPDLVGRIRSGSPLSAYNEKLLTRLA